jgi:cytochrome c peroxidase
VYNATSEDHTNFVGAGGISSISSDLLNFAGFMRLTDPPTPTTSEKNGQALFSSTGCAFCHSPTLTTAASIFTGMSNSTYHPYSDFALHSMGSNLADMVTQGGAGPFEFRTAPLWGVGQRLFFLHDGRTSDLLQTIEAHFSSGDNCSGRTPDTAAPTNSNSNCASEANGVIQNFHSLNAQQKQDLLNFLRSL